MAHESAVCDIGYHGRCTNSRCECGCHGDRAANYAFARKLAKKMERK